MSYFEGLPVPVDPETGDVAPIEDEEAVNHYLRDLARQRAELQEIIERYGVEIERLARERDDLAEAPRRKADLLEGAIVGYLQRLRDRLRADGVEEKKLPTSTKHALGKITSRAGSKKFAVPAEDSEEYIDFFEWVKANAPGAIDKIPASERVNLQKLKDAIEFDDAETGPIWTEETIDPDTGEISRNYAPAALMTVAERTFKAEPST